MCNISEHRTYTFHNSRFFISTMSRSGGGQTAYIEEPGVWQLGQRVMALPRAIIGNEVWYFCFPLMPCQGLVSNKYGCLRTLPAMDSKQAWIGVNEWHLLVFLFGCRVCPKALWLDELVNFLIIPCKEQLSGAESEETEASVRQGLSEKSINQWMLDSLLARRQTNAYPLTGFKIKIAWWIAREPRKSQKEYQEDPGKEKELEGTPH